LSNSAGVKVEPNEVFSEVRDASEDVIGPVEITLCLGEWKAVGGVARWESVVGFEKPLVMKIEANSSKHISNHRFLHSS